MLTRFEETRQQDVDAIREKLEKMTNLAVGALLDCVLALRDNDRQLAYTVILRDQYIDELEKEIDQLCLEFLVRQQPVGALLRFAYGCMKINLELERVGDYAESIAHQFLKLSRVKVDYPKERFVQLADLSIPMLKDSVGAFLNQDQDLACRTITIEDTVDAAKSSLNRDLVALFRKHEIPFEALNPLMMIARRFERVSDQARNICQEALYLCTGESVKHPGSDAFRVLFVDRTNSTLSQMAEAIANSLNQDEFIFSSAGLEPKPIPQATIEFMQTKGLDLSRMGPKAIHEIPNLDHYQVIIALEPQVHQAFPAQPRKVILLDWAPKAVADSETASDSAGAEDEAVYEFLDSHIHEFTEAVTRNVRRPQ